MKKKILIILFIILVILLIFTIKGIRTQIRVMRTGDIMGRISLTISRTLPIEGWKSDYNVVEEIKVMFPNTKLANGKILDAWGNAIDIKFDEHDDNIVILIVSAGPDRVFDTEDDVSRKEIWENVSKGSE